ncbi:bacteriophage abortive infection AbiH family protein [Ignatzschineria cameli]|uniref:Bacteriophage abortive infection AbiH n=2 Tax=Ignatzschineria cameli TaxID=2182793 RepID=A0A2U2AQ96_9GAMM|nr:bacteriophage abortive infection AbiH family protein [Ignatzschineria cameli]PWD85789.1 hypothetical protein DC077_07075 [Ignatzschineria cameli]PWD89417.1 hypothetical protein DC079_06700 [Ignatzschineria cameli]PWD90889.1 hypothetical protein DC081_06410 [Ignatzschineria cameli]PWD91677.1 hypothetical protein DC078_06695 [Ignatzschineria cameli]
MSVLVITGNGFDIWHNLPTKYKNFYNKYSDELSPYTKYFDDFGNKDIEWESFEESLGSFNHDYFLDDSSYRPSIEEMADDVKMMYGYEDDISFNTRELIQNITSSFNKWISSIKVNAAKKTITMPVNCKFINFNYTTTLQKVYGIPDSDILHIHGKAWGKIIFGHGRPIWSKQINDDEPWFDIPQKDAESIYNVFRKPVSDIIQQHQAQLKSYGNIKKIIVIGHSINDIDKPYFEFILKEYPQAKWENYNYGNEIQNTHDRLINLGIPKGMLVSGSTADLLKIYPLP